jgi:hypothetical protein
MTPTKNYSAATIASLFTNANWNYVYNMQRVDEATMNDLIGELENATFSEEEVAKALECVDDTDANAFERQSETSDLNVYLGWLIADRLAQAKVDCPYESVSFSASL